MFACFSVLSITLSSVHVIVPHYIPIQYSTSLKYALTIYSTSQIKLSIKKFFDLNYFQRKALDKIL